MALCTSHPLTTFDKMAFDLEDRRRLKCCRNYRDVLLRQWTAADLKALRTHSRQRTPVLKISKQMKRTIGAYASRQVSLAWVWAINADNLVLRGGFRRALRLSLVAIAGFSSLVRRALLPLRLTARRGGSLTQPPATGWAKDAPPRTVASHRAPATGSCRR